MNVSAAKENAMTNREHEEPSARLARKPGRSQRLAEALRANLRRRKTQARGRRVAQKAPPGENKGL